MGASGAGDPADQTSAPPFYAAGCYAIPIRCLYGTAAEINFWDVVYFCAHQAGGAFDTSTEELARQMGLSRQMVGQLRRAAIERGELIQDVSLSSGRRFELQAPDWRANRGVIWKPLGYVRNGWHKAVTPAIPKRVLNLYLQQPRQQVYRLDAARVADQCRRQFPRGEYKPIAPLNAADVSQALRLLVRLGLFTPVEGGVRIEWAAFNRPAPPAGQFDAPDPRAHPLFCQFAAVDAERAERALELLDIGCYDLDMHLADIFRDLLYVRAQDYFALKSKVYRYRHRPPGPNRWRETWRAFQHELKRRVAQVQTPKTFLDLSKTESACGLLALNLQAGCVLAVRLVSRVEWPWHFEGQAALRLELRAGERILMSRNIGPDDVETRYTLQPGEWSEVLMVQAQCARPLPGVRVEAWLEARLRK